MARKYNLDKVSNHIMLETDLSEEDRDKLLDVVEEQFSQNIRQQKKTKWPRNPKENQVLGKWPKKIA